MYFDGQEHTYAPSSAPLAETQKLINGDYPQLLFQIVRHALFFVRILTSIRVRVLVSPNAGATAKAEDKSDGKGTFLSEMRADIQSAVTRSSDSSVDEKQDVS